MQIDPKYYPSRKVAATAAGGTPAGILLVYFLQVLTGITIPIEVAAALGSVASFVFGYITKDKV